MSDADWREIEARNDSNREDEDGKWLMQVGATLVSLTVIGVLSLLFFGDKMKP